MNSITAPGYAAKQSPGPVAETVHRLTRRHTDDYFFASMSLLILGTVYMGFARSYYLAGTLHARLPSAIIHLHAVVFSAWILLFVAQTTLISISRLAWHKTLGIAGAFLACLVTILGIMAVLDSTKRHFTPPGLTAGRLLALDLLEILVFAILVSWGLLVRRDGAAHKRLILLASIDLLGPAINRWPFYFIHHFPGSTSLVVDAFLLSLIIFDLFSRRRIHRVTVWGSVMIFLFPIVALGPLGPSALWEHFTRWVQR
jgi:hypothetical protein